MAEKSPLSAEELQKLLRMLIKRADGEEATDFEEISEARDCVREKDIQRIIDLGLGRGVDATDRTPWKNKTSFQVRPVTIDNIIGTEEGGGEQSYEREITNASETRGQVRASITDPKATVTIGVEGTYTHSSSSRYKVIGTKVLNRTISFKAHCNDGDIKLPPGSDTFETWLCKWILKNAEEVIYDDVPREEYIPERVRDHVQDEIVQQKEMADYENIRAIQRDIVNVPARRKPLPIARKKRVPIAKIQPVVSSRHETVVQKVELHMTESKIAEICSKFISQYKVTHYVSSIQLGASGYEVITESRKGRKFGAGTHIGVQKIAAGSASGSHSKNHHKKTTDVRKIGVIELKDGIATVKRGTHNEAVVGIQVRPISDLMSSQKLKEILQKALVRYTESKGDASVGPVFIRCATNNLYLNVIGVGHLRATSRKSDASEFYLKSSENPKHPEEFYIYYFPSSKRTNQNDLFTGFRNEETDTIEDAKRVPQYLQTPISIFGSNPGPLEFGYHIRDKETRLVLQSSVRKHHQPPVSLSAWMSGSEICFIQCARRRKNGYLAIKQSEYSTFTCCVPSKSDSSVSTLFQIVQKWEARVDNLMNAKEPLHEDASYCCMADIRGKQLLRAPAATKCTRPLHKGPIGVPTFVEEYNSSSSGEEVPEEKEDDSEEGSHEASLGEYPKLGRETMPKEHLGKNQLKRIKKRIRNYVWH